MKLFAHHFRDEVIPRLRLQARAEAWACVLGYETWSGAWDTVMDHARKLGALYLPQTRAEELEDWISSTLLTEIVEAEREIAR